MATIPTYEDWLNGAGSPYANSYSQEYLNAQYDPFYNQQQGGLDYEKQLAQEQLGRNTQQTQQNYSQSFNDRGLYGSGIYQTEVNKALEGLGRTFNENYGAGQYTPFSQRKSEIEQNRLIAKQQAGLNRQQQAFQAYSTQYYPLMQGS